MEMKYTVSADSRALCAVCGIRLKPGSLVYKHGDWKGDEPHEWRCLAHAPPEEHQADPARVQSSEARQETGSATPNGSAGDALCQQPPATRVKTRRSVESQMQSYEAALKETEQCEGRYPVPYPRDEPFRVTYRCALPTGHDGPHGADESAPRALSPHTPIQTGTRFGGRLQIPFYLNAGQCEPEYDQGHSVIVWYDDLYDLAHPREPSRAERATGGKKP